MTHREGGRSRSRTSGVAVLAPILFCIQAGAASGQPAGTGARWSLDAGLLHTLQADALASPLRYGGLGPGAAFGYERVGAASRTAVSLVYARPRLSSSITRGAAFEESAHRLRLAVPHHRLLHASGPLTVLMGTQLSADVYYRRHDYANYPEHYLDAFVLLEAAAGVEYRAGAKLRIDQRIAIPAAGIVWRSPYTGMKYAPSARLALPDRLQGLTHRLTVSRTLSPTVAVRLTHEVVLLRHSEPWRLAVITQGVRLGVVWLRGGRVASNPGVEEAPR